MNAVNFERCLIGTVIADQKAWAEVMDLGPQDFESKQHRDIWQHVMDLASRDSLSIRSLAEALRSQNQLNSIGSENARGEDFLAELQYMADSTGLKEYHKQVKEASRKRRLEQLGIILTLESRNGKTPDEIIETVEKELVSIQGDGIRYPKSIGSTVDETVSKYERRRKGELTNKWIPQLTAIEEIIPGFNDVDFALYVGTPGSGKSSLARFEAVEGTNKLNKRVAMFSYENTIEECQTWSVAHLAQVNHYKILFPQKYKVTEEEEERIANAWEKVKSLPWYIEEMHGDPLRTVKGMARRLLLQQPLDLIIIDGAYLMSGKSDSKYEVISDNTQGMRSLAQELHVPILATTQFNRGVNNKKEPSQEDLLYAGENPARIIVAITKKDVTDHELALFPENKIRENGREKLLLGKRTRAVVIQGNVLKQTNGEIGPTADIKWCKHTNTFTTLEDGWDMPTAHTSNELKQDAEKIMSTYPRNTFKPAPKPMRKR